MDWWIELVKLWDNPISRGCIAEGVAILVLALAILPLIFGRKPRLTTRSSILRGVVLLAINLTVVVLNQEKNPELYIATVFFIGGPTVWLTAYCRNKDKDFSKLLVIICVAWMLGLLEYGAVLRNYISMFSVVLLLVPAFCCWRDPEKEGFIKIREEHLDALFGAFCVFLTGIVLMPAIGWENLSITSYAKQKQLMLPVSFLLCFLVKAIPEELIFRGIAQGVLRDKWGSVVSVIGSALLFGAFAVNDPTAWTFPNWHAVINMTALGIGCGIVYHKTQSLAVSGMLNASVSFLWWFCFAKGGY